MSLILLRHPSAAAAAAAAPVSSLLTTCRTLRELEQIHARIIRKGLEQHHLLINRFLCLCTTLSVPTYAASVFFRVSAPNLYLWNSLLKAHSDRSPLSATISAFNLMRRRSPFTPDAFTFPSLIKSCSKDSAFVVGASLHCVALRCGLEADVFVRTALVDLYSKCREISAARWIFDTMLHRNEVSYTAMIVGHLNCGDLGSARELFDKMPKRNVVTWNAMIDGCVKFGDLIGARRLFDEMPERNAVSFTSMVHGYAQAGDMASAKLLFDRSEDRDAFSWSAMISGYEQNGRPGDALKIFYEMYEQNIKPDEFIVVGLMSACSQMGSLLLAKWVDSYVATSSIDVKRVHVLAALIDMNAKCGNMERAGVLFDSLPNKDLISYCSMMQGYSMHGHGAQAVDLFSCMLKEGVSPDDVSFTVVLTACSRSGLVEEGKRHFDLMRDDYLIVPSPDHYACMVDLLGRAGQLQEAYELIKLMPLQSHAEAWGALLGACRLYGDVKLGEIVANMLFEIEPLNAGNYVLLSNLYADADRWADVCKLRTMMIERGIRKIPGSTWI